MEFISIFPLFFRFFAFIEKKVFSARFIHRVLSTRGWHEKRISCSFFFLRCRAVLIHLVDFSVHVQQIYEVEPHVGNKRRPRMAGRRRSWNAHSGGRTRSRKRILTFQQRRPIGPAASPICALFLRPDKPRSSPPCRPAFQRSSVPAFQRSRLCARRVCRWNRRFCRASQCGYNVGRTCRVDFNDNTPAHF